MLAGELLTLANAIAHEADALMEEVSASVAFHPVLTKVRKVIETRCALVRRAVDGDRE
jgi:serine/threonine-protein kinase HipA